MQDTAELITLIQSKTPLIVIESRDELQVVEIIMHASTRLRRPLYRWTITQGLNRIDGGYSRHETPREPEEVLQHIWAMKLEGIYVLLDFHAFLEEPKHIRYLKEIALYAEQRKQTVVFISHALQIPDELRHLTASFECSLPDEASLMQSVIKVANQWAEENKSKQLHVNREALNILIQNLKGLSMSEATRMARTAIYNDGAISRDDLPEVIKAKHALLNNENVLSFEYNTAHFSEVGGLARFKEWLQHRKSVFTGTANGAGNTNGLDKPKGLLLLGVQGGGKSLAAKAVAGTWGIPLLRLDFGALYNKYFGETERRTREALKMAETMAPCVLWLDEIEKGIASGDSDNGTSRRLLGTLLTWMAERDSAVFIVATANDIQALPPELLRKGRLDEIFFVDLPDARTRHDIFNIHLTKRNLNPEDFDLPHLIEASAGFSGAEIEQAIVAGLYAAMGGSGHLSSEQLFEQIESTRPLSVVMREKIDAMRAWASDRTVPAH